MQPSSLESGELNRQPSAQAAARFETRVEDALSAVSAPARSERASLLSADELARLDQHDALRIEHVSKRFAKGGGWLPRWGNSKGAAGHNGHQNGRQNGQKRAGTGRRVIRAVDDVSLTVKRREIVGVLGSNGSGKSTLIRLISTLLIPDAGTVAVFGRDVTREERAVQRLINRVSVEAAFFRKLSPMENLLYSARLYGVRGAEARREIRAILTRLGIKPDRVSQPLENMSRGMQQKVAIARAFLTAPILLLLDEPTTGLDPRSKQEVQTFVRELRDTHDATILLTTHDMDEADALCDRIAIIDGGRIVALDTPDGLKASTAAKLGLGQSATLTEVFMAHTGRDWEADEPEDAEDEDEE